MTNYQWYTFLGLLFLILASQYKESNALTILNTIGIVNMVIGLWYLYSGN